MFFEFQLLEKGLPSLPDPNQAPPKRSDESSKNASVSKPTAQTPSLSFSSSAKKGPSKPTTGKRKAIGEAERDKTADDAGSKKRPSKKKAKNAGKTLLSFGDDEP